MPAQGIVFQPDKQAFPPAPKHLLQSSRAEEEAPSRGWLEYIYK